MKLEVGMYCYNKTNRKLGIGKIIDFQSNNNVNIRYKNSIELASIGNVIASFNIIDILECGDYLNGFKVSKIERYDTNTIIKIGNSTFNVLEGEKIYTPSYDNNNGYEKIEKLKSIVTHEQMEKMAYKVGD